MAVTGMVPGVRTTVQIMLRLRDGAMDEFCGLWMRVANDECRELRMGDR